jgi:DNA-binding NarL/FixJ family response regulator
MNSTPPDGTAAPPDYIGDTPGRRPRIRVLVIVEHEFVRRGIAALINFEKGMVCCGEGDGSADVTAALTRCQPDLVLVDLALRQGNGLKLIQAIREAAPHIRIVALAAGESTNEISRVIDAGAAACVRKLETAPRVIMAIRRAYAMRSHLDRPEGGWAAHDAPHHGPGRRSGHRLDETEREIVKLIGQGIPARGIAVRLGLSIPMVDAHRRRIRAKLNVLTATQLVAFCVRWVQQRRDDAHVSH